eukprot:Hpha_TRINITY_DN16919_c2_g1::TRINITY_DN16919_c2_g1_i16::g.56446::m.56446
MLMEEERPGDSRLLQDIGSETRVGEWTINPTPEGAVASKFRVRIILDHRGFCVLQESFKIRERRMGDIIEGWQVGAKVRQLSAECIEMKNIALGPGAMKGEPLGEEKEIFMGHPAIRSFTPAMKEIEALMGTAIPLFTLLDPTKVLKPTHECWGTHEYGPNDDDRWTGWTEHDEWNEDDIRPKKRALRQARRQRGKRGCLTHTGYVSRG